MTLLRKEHNELYAPSHVKVHETHTPRLILVLRGVTLRKNLQSVRPKVRNVGLSYPLSAGSSCFDCSASIALTRSTCSVRTCLSISRLPRVSASSQLCLLHSVSVGQMMLLRTPHDISPSLPLHQSTCRRRHSSPPLPLYPL
jgi:hypothetical protein